MSLAAKLEYVSFRAVYARGIYSLLDETFSLVAALRWQLNREFGASVNAGAGRRPCICICSPMLFGGRSMRLATVERKTGFSGRELAEE